ncbi:MAG: putative PEP-binding protein, partial [archaeon]
TYELKILAGYAKKLEEHYGRPQDIEFAISGQDIYIVQSRPITTKASTLKGKEMTGTVLLSGLGASPGISSGVVKIVRNLNDLTKVQKGDVMVAEMTNPDMVVSMQKASGIVTDEGGVTSHAAIVSREIGIPAVVGTGEATKKLVDGQEVTVDGFTGKVYEGKGETKIVEVLPIVPTKTHIKVIVDLPNFADRAAKSGAKAVGLVRLEGIIAESGKHPVMFEKTNKIGDYMSIIYKGLKEIAKPFQEVWVRSSDIRSDEYMHLEGAPEKPEMNPMLGDHGIRFSLRHKPIFEAEMKAIKQLALENKGKKFGIMVPQVICLDDLKQTKAMAKSLNMPENVKIGIMVETPAAVQIIQDLCEEGMDFISFGTNDLTQYTLAIDRGNEYVQYLYDELNPAVLNSIRYVIRKCRKYGVETSICGQSASKEEMVRFLIGEGIDSLSVNADAAQKVSMLVAELEKKSVVQSGNVNVPPNPGKMNSPNNQNKSNKSNKNDNPVQGKKPEVDELDNAGKKEDIEEIILNELSKDEYSPSGARDSRQEIPLLNDSIPVGSDLFENKKEEKEFDLTRELG